MSKQNSVPSKQGISAVQEWMDYEMEENNCFDSQDNGNNFNEHKRRFMRDAKEKGLGVGEAKARWDESWWNKSVRAKAREGEVAPSKKAKDDESH